MFNLAVKKFFEKNLPLKVYGNLNLLNSLSVQNPLLFPLHSLPFAVAASSS